MSLRNFDANLKNILEEELLDEEKQPIPMRKVIATALVADTEESRKVSFESKEERYQLACRIIKGGDIDLNVKELALIRDLVGKNLTVVAVGQISKALESELGREN